MSKKYEVTVNTGGSLNTFETHDSDIFRNVFSGNSDTVFFKTTDGKSVMVPTRFMITHQEVQQSDGGEHT